MTFYGLTDEEIPKAMRYYLSNSSNSIFALLDRHIVGIPGSIKRLYELLEIANASNGRLHVYFKVVDSSKYQKEHKKEIIADDHDDDFLYYFNTANPTKGGMQQSNFGVIFQADSRLTYVIIAFFISALEMYLLFDSSSILNVFFIASAHSALSLINSLPIFSNSA